MSDQNVPTAPVVFADRVYLSEKAGAELSRMGGYAWADAGDAFDLAGKIGGSPDVKVIVTEYVPVDETVLNRAPALKAVIAYGAGYDHIDVQALKRRGVLTCNCPGENSQAVAELTFGLMLCLLRRIHRADQWVRSGEWYREGLVLPRWASGRELWRKTLGVIGLGNIGVRVVRIAGGFDMKIIGYDPAKNDEQLIRLGVEPAALPDLLSRSDIVTLHVPLTPDTEGMIDAAALKSVKPGLILVNTSRGRVIDESAMIEALQSGRIGAAALDVFASEPLSPSNPLADMENVLLSPHLGALTREAGDRLCDSIVRQVRDILKGRPPEGLIR
ncbi:MAG: hydroxyacid dehydrogenase [Bacteriovoracaceae bacterium]|nr:hydroxyacid dehydrogenase [Bacteriovoracaceae bacterium]HPW70137.1 hydroxyacid dehydrogenase [Deltaproteobacteria bacterium]